MQIFALISFGVFVAVSLMVGFRLLRLAWRTRLAPELAIGAQIFFAGGIGYPLWVLGSSGKPPEALMPLLGVLTPLLLSLGAVALYIGIWRIFRPTEVWAGVVAALGSVLALAPEIYDAVTGLEFSQPALTYWMADLARLGCFGWASAEAFAHFRMMRRRQRIGLAEPALANRFLLWGMATASAALLVIASTVNWILFPRGAVGTPIVLIQSVLGLMGSILIWFSFYPPRALEGILLQPSGNGDGSDG
jgi:hypothetical protein